MAQTFAWIGTGNALPLTYIVNITNTPRETGHCNQIHVRELDCHLAVDSCQFSEIGSSVVNWHTTSLKHQNKKNQQQVTKYLSMGTTKETEHLAETFSSKQSSNTSNSTMIFVFGFDDMASNASTIQVK